MAYTTEATIPKVTERGTEAGGNLSPFTPPKRYYTEAEYLRLERAAPYKSEYIRGEIFPMAGAKPNHVRISRNISTALDVQLMDRDCEVFGSDIRVRIAGTKYYSYPDLVALCGTPELYDGDTLENPQLIVEVLSASTAHNDLGDKWQNYQRLDSLTDYLLVAQNEIHITHHTRQAGGDDWQVREYTDANDTLIIESLQCRLRVGDLYRKVNFNQPD